ncbi:MAG: hypothetical protein ABUL58_06450, partial [Steroidobacter sp.]
YVLEKQKTENYLRNLSRGSSITVSILQPTIVYGLGGNWTANAIDGALSKTLDILDNGERYCHAVHVSDVAQAIWSRATCTPDGQVSTFIVNGPDLINWRQFYKGHAQALGATLNVEQFVDNGKMFHAKLPINMLLWFWFRTPLGHVFNGLMSLARRRKKSSGPSQDASASVKARIDRGIQSMYRPIAMSRVAHAARFTVANDGATALYAQPRKSFVDGIRELQGDLKNINTR